MAIYGSLGDIEVTADYPSIQPTLDLNFAKSKALDPRITFYRNSLGTYVDDKGIIRTVPENVPRFDHNPTSGESLGLLIEESRTNLRTNSENFSVWGSGGDRITVSNNTVTAPDGNLTADSFIEQANTKTWRWIEWGQSCTSGTAYTVSCFVKPGTGTFGVIYFFPDNSVFNNTTTTFNLSGNGSVAVLGSSTTATITAYPNGWYRISATQTAAASSTGYFAIGFAYSSNLTVSPAGSTSNTVGYVWGVQLETGSFPTSYIPTSATSVTRSADVCYMDGTNFSSWYNPIESTFYTNYVMNSLDGAYNNPSFYAYDNASAQNYLAIFGYNPAYAWAQASNTTASGISLGGTTTTNVDYKVSFGVKLNDFAASINGSTVSTDTNGNVPVVNQMFIGKRVEVSNAHLNGTLKRLTYYPKRLTNAQLQNLTA